MNKFLQFGARYGERHTTTILEPIVYLAFVAIVIIYFNRKKSKEEKSE